MSDSLVIFGKTYSGVPSIIAIDTNGTALQYIRPQGSKTINQNGSNIDVATYATVNVSVSGGGNGDYTRTTICPSTTFTIPSGSDYYSFLPNTERIVSGDEYIVTFDNVEYVCTSTELWSSDRFVGDLVITWGNKTSDYIFPFCIEDWNSNQNFVVYARDNNQHTIKIEHLELLTDGTALGTKTITTNGTYNASTDSLDGYSSVTVNVSGGSPDLQTKSVSFTPTETAQSQTVTPDSGKDGLSSVDISVGAISNTYVGTGITRRSSTDLTASGATVTVPAGYYSAQASKAVASGSAKTPETTITANPSISVSTSGLITATTSASQSITPSVSAGYVSSGTAGTVSVNGGKTQQLSTQAASTITPTKTSQIAISAGKYTIGTITVAAIPAAYQDVTGVTATASDVVSGKDIVNSSGTVVHGSLVIQHYYTGSSDPSASTGVNGDIYLKVVS